jgi:hypothetical protein
MRMPGQRTASALLFALAAVPAWADGTLGLGEVLVAVDARHGNHWKYLGGGRAAPYECQIGKRTVLIEADRVYFDERGSLLGDLDKADPKHAKTFKEDNFRWAWTP